MAIEIKFKEKSQNQTTNKVDLYSFNRTFVIEQPKTKFLSCDLVRDIKELPLKNQCIHVAVRKAGILTDILPLFKDIEDINCSFAVIDEHQVNELNKIDKMSLAVVRGADSSSKSYLSPIVKNLKAKEIKIRTTHVKLFLIKTKEAHYSIQTSLNPKINPSFENIIITEGETKYNIYKKMLNDF